MAQGRGLHEEQNHSDMVVRIFPPVQAEFACGSVGIENWSSIHVRDSTESEFRLLRCPTALARMAFRQGRILFRLADLELLQIFLVTTNINTHEAFDNVAKRSKVNAIVRVSIEAAGNGSPSHAALATEPLL